ncbi:MAG: alpha/beta hydrolase [Bacillota bacterium]
MSEQIRQRLVPTSRLKVHVRESGSGSVPVIFVHGNCSSGAYFEELMLALPPQYRAIAPDLRGFGGTEPLPIDATRGCGDWADDLAALVDALALDRFHLVGWSMGGGVAMRYALEQADRLLSLTLIAPVSPYGFGGTKDLVGTPNAPDYAGSGGGTANGEFVKAIASGDRGAESQVSPRNIINAFYVKPPFRGTPEQEERWVDSVLTTRTGDDYYPGDMTPSPHWPGAAPGTRGINNAISPKYHNLAAFAELKRKVPVLWVRGDSDQIVSDTSLFDLAFLGQLGVVPGWPGAELCPPQPMIGQTRAVLEAYRANGGSYEEVVIADAGHSPFIEKPAEFQTRFFALLEQSSR